MKVAHRSFPDHDSNVRIVIDIVTENIPKDPKAPNESIVKIQAQLWAAVTTKGFLDGFLIIYLN